MKGRIDAVMRFVRDGSGLRPEGRNCEHGSGIEECVGYVRAQASIGSGDEYDFAVHRVLPAFKVAARR